MSDYPRMLYRCGKEQTVCEDFNVDTRIVDDEEGEIAALDEGWRTSPAPPEKPKKAA
jgi:hypothetical protein